MGGVLVIVEGVLVIVGDVLVMVGGGASDSGRSAMIVGGVLEMVQW